MRLLLITAVGAALVLATAAPGWADGAAGKVVFTAKGCNACHYTDGPAKEKTIDDQLAKKGPELWYAGSKFQKAWLGAWLQDPKPVRLLKYGTLDEKNPGDHPKLTGADAANMTDFLMSLTSDAVKAGVVKPKKNLKGKLIFIKKMPCNGCHQSPGRKGKITGGLSGPTLVGAGKRLNPDWIYAYLKTPSVFKPVKAMPTFAGILKDKDTKNVATHVANMK
jgi:cytochrome c551/c552